tara:strand:- start:10748 stop:11305 length:558 start_codon:yes stop_codon:yes gene_type:complete
MIIKLPLDKHILIKSQLQQHIKNGWAEPKQSNDKYYNDNISKTDWDIANNYERPWVKFFLPFFKPHLLEMIQSAGYANYELFEIWFQSYNENSTHGWHIHGRNFTGVYYVNLPEGTPQTELYDRELGVFPIKAKEGDIVMFPSHTIHRAPKMLLDKEKTIISFNVEMKGILDSELARIENTTIIQ